MKLKIKKIRPRGPNQMRECRGMCSYICIRINAVENFVMLQLYLWHDVYNIIFKMKQIICRLIENLFIRLMRNFCCSSGDMRKFS
jgi:hypothetical protein